ncbi:MAG: hypothetical protein N2316_00750 [Spirochaetes bacterium]|nr:hypothetical protein [Spirochaetota bacterium]
MNTKIENWKHATCPGLNNIKTPQLFVVECPSCGENVEIFSDEIKAPCPRCSQSVHRHLSTCAHWCAHGRECIDSTTSKE